MEALSSTEEPFGIERMDWSEPQRAVEREERLRKRVRKGFLAL